MSTLNEYLAEKRIAVRNRNALTASGANKPNQLAASVSAEGRSGVRRIRIRDHQVISDSPYNFAGYDLGPSSPELQLGVLGSCVTHIFLIQAADQEVPIDSINVEVTGQIDPRAGKPGFEAIPVWPHELAYTVHIQSPASKERIDALFELVERSCPILNLLRHPQSVRGAVAHTQTDTAPQPSSEISHDIAA